MGKQAMLHMGISHSTSGEQWYSCQLHMEVGPRYLHSCFLVMLMPMVPKHTLRTTAVDQNESAKNFSMWFSLKSSLFDNLNRQKKHLKRFSILS